MDARRLSRGRILKSPGVGQLSPEVKPAQKAEHLSKRSAFLTSDSLRQREIGALIEEEGGSLSA